MKCGLAIRLRFLHQLDEFSGGSAQRLLASDDNAEGTVKVLVRKMHLSQGFVLHLFLHTQERNYRHTSADFNAAFNGLDVVELHSHRHADFMFLEDSVHGALTCNPFFECDE